MNQNIACLNVYRDIRAINFHAKIMLESYLKQSNLYLNLIILKFQMLDI